MHMTSDTLSQTLTVILAGGRGDRLYPLTRERAKPAVPFGGDHRLIDFTLSNCFNSNLRRICILTQYKPESVHSLVRRRWRRSVKVNEFICCLPPSDGKRYMGTADAVYQNIGLIRKTGAQFVLILSGDHIYRMDYSELIRFHLAHGSDVTLSAIEVPRALSRRFGVLDRDGDGRVRRFEEKPQNPQPMPGNPNRVLANMGVYVFNIKALVQALARDAKRAGGHDFGNDILPELAACGKVYAYGFNGGQERSQKYWRDVGTLDSYYEASMDLLRSNSRLSLDETRWPMRSPAHGGFFNQSAFIYPGFSRAVNSIVSPGTVICGGQVSNSVLSPGVSLAPSSQVQNSVLMQGVRIGRGARIRRAIVQDGANIPDGTEIGYDVDHDRRRFFVTEGGVVVVPASL